jgi:hypothetical protein
VFDKPINAVLAVCLGIAMLVIVALSGINWSLNNQLDTAISELQAKAQDIAVLSSAVNVQNQAIDEYAAEIEQTIVEAELAWNEAQPFIQQEERRILGIRSAPDNANDPEKIRLKMLRDAKL